MDIKTVKDLAAAIKESGKSTQSYDTTATVTRIDGGTAWVHIPGGVDETPVQLSVNAKKGDTVNVRVSGGRAWITGNATAPPTDDTAAKVANQNALAALKMLKKVLEATEIDFEALEEAMADLEADLEEQIDAKVETWAQEGNPAAAWTTTKLKEQHNGDLWYYTGVEETTVGGVTIVPTGTYKYNASTGKWTAHSMTSDNLFNLASGKTTIWSGSVEGSYPEAEIGDFLFDNTDGEGKSYRWNGSTWVPMQDFTTTINYFWHDDAGVHVATVEGSATSGPNALMSATGFRIRNGTTVLAEFLANLISLGQETAEINLCGGAAVLKKLIGYGGDNSFNIYSNPDYNESTHSYGTSAIGLIAQHPEEQTHAAYITLGVGGDSGNITGAVTISAKTFISLLLQQGGGRISLLDRALTVDIGDASNPGNILKGNIYFLNVNSMKSNGYEVVTEAKASSAAPAANGTAAAGSSTNYARADHVHPLSSLGYQQLATGTHQSTAADTWEYTGITFTTTAACILYIRTNTSSARKRPTGLGLHSANTLASGSYPDEIAYTAEHAERTPIYWVPAGTYYVYQKRAAAGTAAATITVNKVLIT